MQDAITGCQNGRLLHGFLESALVRNESPWIVAGAAQGLSTLSPFRAAL